MSLLRKLSDCWLALHVMILFPVLIVQENPQRITTCSCRYKNLTYDLSPLAMTNNKSRFTCNASPGYLFSYNPCLPFTRPNQTGSRNCTNVAICYWSDRASDYNMPYGYQHLIHCVIKDGNVALRYKYKDGRLFSYVKLICNESQTDMKNAFKWISGTTKPILEVNHRYICPRELQSTNVSTSKDDVWFWTAIGESAILLLIIIVCIITCVYKSCKRPAEPHEQREPLLDPPPLPPGNPNQPPIFEPNEDADVIPPPDDFNVQPQREPEDQLAPGRNEGQNGEQRVVVEPRNEPVNDDADIGNEPVARPNGQGNEVDQVQPEENRFDVPGNEPGQAIGGADGGGADGGNGDAQRQGGRVPVERSATSDEDSMTN